MVHTSQGWTAYLPGNIMFVKRFSVDHFRGYPDMGCNIEAYVKDTCLEIETLGPLSTLKPKESVTLEETWEVKTGDYPPTLESARKISKQLSLN